MPNRKSDATEDDAAATEAGGPADDPRAEGPAAEDSDGLAIPGPGAESVDPAASEDTEPPAEPVDTVSVDEAGSAPEPSAEEAVDEAEAHESHPEEAGTSLAARALGFLVILLAGAALGIWAAPKIAPLLPSGLRPVADWLTPGRGQAEAEVAALQARLDQGLGDVQTRIAALSAGDDVDSRIETAVSAAETRLSAEIGALQETVGQLDGADSRQRLARLEAAVDGQKAELDALKAQLSGSAAASGQISDEAVAKIDVYRADIDGLRAEMGTLQDKVSGLSTRIDEVAANADRQIATAQDRVGQIQTQADTALTAAETDADIALIRAALASGQPFADPLDKLSGRPGVTVPDGLTAAAPTGVATMAQLRDSYPDAAHAAIRASIMAGAGDGVIARSRAYLEAQVSSRSLTPQSGMGPDAVLSRMEERLRHDDLKGALDESAQLPSEAAAAMSGWLDAARLRLGAVEGLATLESTLPATN